MAFIKERKFRITSHIDNLDEAGIPEGDAERTESSPNGFFKISEDEYRIEYTETENGDKTVCEVIIKSDSVRVTRRGALKSDMIFEEGKEHSSLYSVGPYSFDCVVFTKKIRNNVTRDGGKLDIFYKMTIGGQDKNVKMRIEI